MSPADRREKKSRLRQYLRRKRAILLAFSGGKDSFFLLREATLALGEANVFAYFVRTPFTGEAALERVAYFRSKFPFPLREIRIDLLADARLRSNPRQRCFYCKQRMFTTLKKEARRLGIETVADGTTVSDQQLYRPGRRALDKLAVWSPLKDAGFEGSEIVAELKALGIDEYHLTSSTCLATRFPYDVPLTADRVAAIGQVEHFLIGKGIHPLRVRFIPDGVRIETPPANFKKTIALKKELQEFCQARGFTFVTLDLGGMRSGPWDEPPAAAVPVPGVSSD